MIWDKWQSALQVYSVKSSAKHFNGVDDGDATAFTWFIGLVTFVKHLPSILVELYNSIVVEDLI